MRLCTIAFRVAGAPTQLIRDLNLDEVGLVIMIQTAQSELIERGYNGPQDLIWEAMTRAAEKAMPGVSKKLPKWALPADSAYSGGISVEFLVHEMEHLLFDPAFDLINNNPGHHPVESVMDEAFASGIAGDAEVAEGAYQASKDFLDKFLHGNTKTVGELLDYIKSSPISTKEKKRIRDAVYADIERTFGKYRGRLRAEEANIEIPNCSNDASWSFKITAVFLDGTLKRYEPWKDLMTEEMEDTWRRFVLHARNEIRKVLKNI